MKYIKFLAQVALIAVTVLLLDTLGRHMSSAQRHTATISSEPAYDPTYYPEVVYMLANDSIMNIHRFWGIDTIEYYDWEETANAVGLPVNMLTIDIYMDYLQKDTSTEYVYGTVPGIDSPSWIRTIKHNRRK